jgi:hypothetical protein
MLAAGTTSRGELRRCWGKRSWAVLTTASYLSFTKSKTKIAHTPTVTGNCTNSASRIPLPLGRAKLSKNIANAVSIPRANLVLEFMVVSSRFQARPCCKLGGGNLVMSIIFAKSASATHLFSRNINGRRSSVLSAKKCGPIGRLVVPEKLGTKPLRFTSTLQ